MSVPEKSYKLLRGYVKRDAFDDIDSDFVHKYIFVPQCSKPCMPYAVTKTLLLAHHAIGARQVEVLSFDEVIK